VDDADTVAGLSADGREWVFVHVNAGPHARRLELAADRLGGGAWSTQAIVTSETRKAEAVCRTAEREGDQVVIAPARSITTVRIVRAVSAD
jgi:hypothetical protein